MAEKKINEVTAVTTMADGEYIIVTLADGSVGRIKKSDLISLATNSKDGLLAKGNVNQLKSFYLSVDGKKYIKLGRFNNAHNQGGSVLINLSHQAASILVYISFIRAYVDSSKSFKAKLVGGSVTGQVGNFYLVPVGAEGITGTYDLYFEQITGNQLQCAISFSNANLFTIESPSETAEITPALTATIFRSLDLLQSSLSHI